MSSRKYVTINFWFKYPKICDYVTLPPHLLSLHRYGYIAWTLLTYHSELKYVKPHYLIIWAKFSLPYYHIHNHERGLPPILSVINEDQQSTLRVSSYNAYRYTIKFRWNSSIDLGIWVQVKNLRQLSGIDKSIRNTLSEVSERPVMIR